MKHLKTIGAVLWLAALLAVGICTLTLPQRSFSLHENRTLTTTPAWSWKDFLSGDYQEKLSDSLSDQFPLRDRWMALGSSIKQGLGRRDIGNTYIGSEGYLFEKVTDSDIDRTRWSNNLSLLNRLAQQYPNIPFQALFVPSSGTILTENLPKYAELYDAEGMMQEAEATLTACETVNPTEDLRTAAAEGQIYFRTDHHWTAWGAFAAYQALTHHAGAVTEYEAEDTAGEVFLGTLYSRVLTQNPTPDKVELPKLKDTPTVTVNGQPSQLYHMEKLNEKDQYQVFLGGNFGIVELSGTGKGTLLLLKDSFANCFVPYLTAEYEKIVMIDLRYYPSSVKALLDTGEFDRVLTLYELNNFANDSNFAKLSLK